MNLHRAMWIKSKAQNVYYEQLAKIYKANAIGLQISLTLEGECAVIVNFCLFLFSENICLLQINLQRWRLTLYLFSCFWFSQSQK